MQIDWPNVCCADQQKFCIFIMFWCLPMNFRENKNLLTNKFHDSNNNNNMYCIIVLFSLFECVFLKCKMEPSTAATNLFILNCSNFLWNLHIFWLLFSIAAAIISYCSFIDMVLNIGIDFRATYWLFISAF